MLVAAASHDVWEIAAHPWVSDQKTFGQLYLQIGLESQRAVAAQAVEIETLLGCRGVRCFDEPVAEPDDSFDLKCGGTELSPEPADMHVHRSGFDRVLVAPDPLEEAVAGNHAIAVLYEIAEQLELATREPNGSAVHGDGHGVEIRHQMFAAIYVRANLQLSPPQGRTHARGEFAWVGNRPLTRQQAAELRTDFERLWLAVPAGLVSLADAEGCDDPMGDERELWAGVL